MNDLILYTTEDGRSLMKLRAKDQTVWLSQREMGKLFDVSTDNVGLPRPLAAWRAVPPLGLHHSEGMPAQGLRDGRRAPQKPRRPPELLRRDAGAHPGLRKALLPEGPRPPRPEQRLRQDGQGHAGLLRHGAESLHVRRDAEDGCRIDHGPGEPADAHFGLLAWKGGTMRKADIVVAKNYLTEDEIDTLSKGYRHRTCLDQALPHDPEVLILKSQTEI